MAHKKRSSADEVVEIEAKEIAEAIEAEALAEERESDDVTNSGTTPPPIPPPAVSAEPQPEWVTKAKPLSGKTGEPNGAWHDYFKEPLPTTPPIAKWAGADATYSQFEGGRILAEYREGGFFAVLTTPPPAKRPVARR